MRLPWVLVARSLLIGSVSACSSSSAAGTVPASDAPTSDASAVRDDASPDASVAANDDAAAAGDDAASSGLDGSIADAGTSHAEVDASMACVSFCKCMAMNCAGDIFPDGCLYDCATQTNWDLSCRATMCTLVPAQPNNDHCEHAFGISECLDQ
jgi:hypothetical protein